MQIWCPCQISFRLTKARINKPLRTFASWFAFLRAVCTTNMLHFKIRKVFLSLKFENLPHIVYVTQSRCVHLIRSQEGGNRNKAHKILSWVVGDKTCRLPELYEWKWVPCISKQIMAIVGKKVLGNYTRRLGPTNCEMCLNEHWIHISRGIIMQSVSFYGFYGSVRPCRQFSRIFDCATKRHFWGIDIGILMKRVKIACVK